MGGTAPVPAFKIGAKGLGEEAPRRLSGHGFLTEGREERRMSGSEFSSPGKTSVLTNPKSKPIRGRAVTGPTSENHLIITELGCFRRPRRKGIREDEAFNCLFELF
jgi:hypothetical protein